MKKYAAILASSLLLNISFQLYAAESQMAVLDEATYEQAWAEAPFSKCTTIQQKMTCAFAQLYCKQTYDESKCEVINQQRGQNRLNPAYELPALEDFSITAEDTALFISLIKNKVVDTQ